MNSRMNTLSGAKPCFYGQCGFRVAEVRSLFPQLRASIWESCRQKVHRTVVRARFAFKIAQTWCDRSTFG